MKIIIFIFLFSSYLSANSILSLNVIKFNQLDIKNVTKADASLCVNTSEIQKGSYIYLSLESKDGKLNSEIYYKSVEKCPSTYKYKKGDSTLKSLKPTIQQVVTTNKKSNFFYEYNIPKYDDKKWYLVIYTGFKGKTMTVTFKPFSTSSFVIILLIVLGSIILIIASICIFCCCCCCRTKGKGKIYQYDNSYKGDNLIYNTIN